MGFKKGDIPRSVKRSEKHAQILNKGKEGLLAGCEQGIDRFSERTKDLSTSGMSDNPSIFRLFTTRLQKVTFDFLILKQPFNQSLQWRFFDLRFSFQYALDFLELITS